MFGLGGPQLIPVLSVEENEHVHARLVCLVPICTGGAPVGDMEVFATAGTDAGQISSTISWRDARDNKQLVGVNVGPTAAFIQDLPAKQVTKQARSGVGWRSWLAE